MPQLPAAAYSPHVPGPAVSVAAVHYPSAEPLFEPSVQPVSRARYQSGRRKKSSAVPMLVVLGALVAVGGSITLIVLLSRQSQQTPHFSNPVDLASHKARELMSQHYKLPAEARFSVKGDKVRRTADGRWVVASYVDVPSRVPGTDVRMKWAADIVQNGEIWKLERLEVDGELIVARGDNMPPPPTDLATRPSWLSETYANEDDRRIDNLRTMGEDKSTRAGMNRLAMEIGESVKLRKTLVVWLVDRSASVRPQLQEAQRHMDAVYGQLSAKSSGESPPADAPLRMAVGTFGSEVQFTLEEPTSSADEIRKAIESVEEDPSGKELTFTAIIDAIKKYQAFRAQGGYVILALVTDETGDDENRLEEALALVRQHAIAVHVIGVSAPFGRQVSAHQRLAESGGKSDKDAPLLVQQGPESRQSELIDLAFPNSPVGGNDLDQLDSGFGPFSLTWLCQESGGTYFTCSDFGVGAGSRMIRAGWMGASQNKPIWDPKVIRKYAPDYVTEADYRQILTNKACAALVEAARQPRIEVLNSFQTSFPKSDEASFKRLLDGAQREAAKFEPKVMAFCEILQRGEADRGKLTRPRWQAGFDLALGRALAARVRAEGYNSMLAKLKSSSTFTKQGSTTWTLQPHETKSATSVLEKMLNQSLASLNGVVKQHPGTPWALMAERELQTKLGWEWTEN